MSLLDDLYWAAAVAASPVQRLDPAPVVFRRTTREAAEPPCGVTTSGVPVHVRPSCRCAHPGRVSRHG